MSDAKAAAGVDLDGLRAGLPADLADLPDEYVEAASIVVAQYHRGHDYRPLLRVMSAEVRDRLQGWINDAGETGD